MLRTTLLPRHVRYLGLDSLLHPHGRAHLGAARALVRVHGLLYLVADDEQHLGMLEEASLPDTPVQLLRLFEGDLPRDKGKRRQAKPDLETLALLPALPGCPHGALLAFGSGSRPNRQVGVLLALDARGAVTGRMTHIDLSGLYGPLHTLFPDLNIEGAFLASGELRLLQRGNQGDARNACISFDWNQVAPWLAGRRPEPPAAKSVVAVELGAAAGVPLGLTDGAALPGGSWVFCAVAENTTSSFEDGSCAASVVGVVGPDGQLRQLHYLHGAPKVEGIAVRPEGDALVLTLVTDADDPAVASQLLEVRMPHA